MSWPSGPARSSTLGWPGTRSIGRSRYSAAWREHRPAGLVVDAPDPAQRLLLDRKGFLLRREALSLDVERLLLQREEAIGAHPQAHGLVGGAQKAVRRPAITELAKEGGRPVQRLAGARQVAHERRSGVAHE